MPLKLYNSKSKSVEEFRPLHPKKVTMYNCGPTVYSTAHIGNFRSFVVVDLLRRVLEHEGYEVTQVMNITDVGHLTDDGDEGEDKLEVAAKKEKVHPLDIAEKYTQQFLRDSKTLNLLEPHHRPKATETVSEMIAMVEVLLQRGHAYKSGENIYFDITSFEKYGDLSGNTLEKLSKHRVESDPNKRHPQDFVLWFGHSKYQNHILKWDSPWGEGYPGWHMECSAMAARYLTKAFDNDAFDPEKFETIDIHTGGEDNRFPHHECEIAQSEGVTGKAYVNLWLHVRHLMIEGEKMSKSLGNIYYVQQLIDEGFTQRAIRYALLSTHYRSPLNFTKQGLRAAQKTLDRIDQMLRSLDRIRAEKLYDEILAAAVNQSVIEIERHLADDLNISGAMGALMEAVHAVNKHYDSIGNHQAKELLMQFFNLGDLFGFIDKSVLDVDDLPQAVVDMLQLRSEARMNKDWAESDRLREELKNHGILVSDTSYGQQWKRSS